MIRLSEQEWQARLADRRALIGELRATRNLLKKVMVALAWAHANNAPQEPFWEYAGITEEQYRWWEENK